MILTLDATFRDQSDTFLKLFCKTQDSIDITALAKLVPHDQRYQFEAAWEIEADGRKSLVFTKVAVPVQDSAPESDAALMAKLSPAELETLAAERGVPWDPAASTTTMIERVLAAAPPQPTSPAAEPPSPVVVTNAETPTPKKKK